MRVYSTVSLVLLSLVLNSGCAAVLGQSHKSAPKAKAPSSVLSHKPSTSRALRFQFTPNDALSAMWDYLPADESNVLRFEIAIDTNPQMNLGKPVPLTTTSTLLTYKAVIGTFAVGTHTAVIFACNDVGCGIGSPSVNFTVDPIAPVPTVPAAPTNLRITGVTSDTVALMWDDVSSNEEGFSVEQNNTEVLRVGANITSGITTGLLPVTSYTFRSRAYNGYGYSPYSSSTVGTTGAPEDTVSPTAAITYFRHNGNSRNYSTTVQAADSIGVTRVRFLVDSVLVATLLTPSLGTPQLGSYSITFTQSVNGIHLLTVEVYDAQNNKGVASQTFLR